MDLAVISIHSRHCLHCNQRNNIRKLDGYTQNIYYGGCGGAIPHNSKPARFEYEHCAVIIKFYNVLLRLCLLMLHLYNPMLTCNVECIKAYRGKNITLPNCIHNL